MTIGIISNLYPPLVVGGAEMVAQTMAEGLRKHGQRVFVITTRPYQSLKSLTMQREMAGEVPVYRFYPLNFYHYAQGFRFHPLVRFFWHVFDIFNVHSVIVIKKILGQEKPDIVITHNMMGIGFLIPRLIRRLGMRHVHILHDVQLYNPSGLIVKGETSFAQLLANALGYSTLMKFLFSKTNLIISPSQFLLDFYRDRGFLKNIRTAVLPNPVQLPPASSDQRQGPALPRLGFTGPTLRLVYVGHLSKAKGIAGLVEVMLRLHTMPLTLKVIGKGPLMTTLKEKTASDSRISFYGWLSPANVREILHDSDIVVVPTLCYDNSPTVVFEALSSGVPVIVSDIGGAKEIVRDGYNGWVFEADNWSALGQLLTRLAGSRQEVSLRAAQARASIAHLSIDQYTRTLLNRIGT